MEKPILLIVDDEESIRTQMKWALSNDYEVFLASDRESALKIVKSKSPPLVGLDLGLPPSPHSAEEGFATLNSILQHDSSVKVVIISGNHDRENAIKAIAQGAHDFFSKPAEIDELRIILKRALYLYRLEKENQELQQRLSQTSFSAIIGSSVEIQEILSGIQKVATTDVPVLITGESGTGKELVAKAIHLQSNRPNEPFITINCAAIPESLLEAELFGHEKGAFTGAYSQRIGRFEQANHGTLFLDEIGELSPGLQAKLLRFLQDHRIDRIGGRAPIDLDVRVLAATNRNLKESIQTGTFREDLYFRLMVIALELPPLRKRGSDILLIATALLKRFSPDLKRPYIGFDDAAIQAMQAYEWPGNVRELENKIKRAVIMANGQLIMPKHLDLPTISEPAPPATLREARDRFEKDMAVRTLTQYNWNITRAAKTLGISRQALHDIMAKHQLKK